MPYFWLLDCIQEKELKIKFVRSMEMLADMLTKPLPLPAFRRHVILIFGCWIAFRKKS